MSTSQNIELGQYIDALYRSDGRIVLATLIRLLGNFDLAEEAFHEAIAAALQQWPKSGIPAKPRAWLVSTGRFKAIDTLRRRGRFDAALAELYQKVEQRQLSEADWEGEAVHDNQLRLIFTCCHPALSAEARIALTLREVMGLKTEEIARAFLCPTATIAQRIVRAKAKIQNAGIPFVIPQESELAERLETVLSVIYLVYNEGYSASSGQSVLRTELSAEAIRLARLLLELLPHAELWGLLALMLLHESRRQSRSGPDGEMILLENQDRSLWDRRLIAEGVGLVQRSLASRDFGPYTIQAAIAAVHAEADSTANTDWQEITGLYDALLQLLPSPVVELNRAVAVSMRDGPQAGLALIDDMLARGLLGEYHLIHAARADMYRRLGLLEQARAAYTQALSLSRQAPEQRFLQRRIAECQ